MGLWGFYWFWWCQHKKVFYRHLASLKSVLFTVIHFYCWISLLQCKLQSSSQVQTPKDNFLSGLCYLKAESDSSTTLFPGQCYSGPSINVVPVEIFHEFVTVNLKITTLFFKIHKIREKITKYLYILYFSFGIILLAQTSARSTLSAWEKLLHCLPLALSLLTNPLTTCLLVLSQVLVLSFDPRIRIKKNKLCQHVKNETRVISMLKV